MRQLQQRSGGIVTPSNLNKDTRFMQQLSVISAAMADSDGLATLMIISLAFLNVYVHVVISGPFGNHVH
jgi:hypothetical protein